MRQVGKIGKRDADEMQIWTVEEYGCFSEAIMDKPQAFTAFEVLFWTGIREGELLALTPGDFDFGKDLLHITKSYQRIRGEDRDHAAEDPEVEPGHCDAERFWPKRSRSTSLCSASGTGNVSFRSRSHSSIGRWDAVAKRSGVKRIRVHDLRHSPCRFLLTRGSPLSPLRTVSDMRRWMSPTGTRIFFPSVQRDMADVLQNLRGDGK